MARFLRSERLMDTFIPLFVAFAVGVGSSVQIAMIGGMARVRSAPEATFTSLMATVAGVAIVLAIRGMRGDAPFFHMPMDRGWAFFVVAAVSGALLVLSMRGLHPAYAITGIFATLFLLGTAWLVPKIGIALYFGATTAGSLVGAMIFDQIGAFGAQATSLSPLRILGVLAVFGGVILVRIAR